MKKLLLIAAIIAALVIPHHAMAVGSVTETFYDDFNMKMVTLAWTSDAAGDVSVALSTEAMKLILGRDIQAVVTIPGAGDDAPTDNYDVYLYDSNSMDILGNAAMNRSTSATQIITPYVGAAYGYSPVYDNLTLIIDVAGNANKGTVKLICR